MEKVLVFLVCLLPLLSLSVADPTPPKYVVDLDQPPKQQWSAVMRDYHQVVKDSRKMVAQYIPKEVLPLVEKLGAGLDKYLPGTYPDQLRGVAADTNMTLTDTILLNIAYDLASFCTSIVTQDANGTVWHARNLDFTWENMLRNLTITVDFHRNGKLLYTGVTWAGYVGLLTGQRPRGWTVSVNSRDGEHGPKFVNILVAILDRKAIPTSFLIRDALREISSYPDAVSALSSAPVIAESYFILAGVKAGEACILTRSHERAIDVWHIGDAEPKWFLVQTNYNHWNKVPASDDRRHPAMNGMKTMGQSGIGVKGLYDVLSIHPVYRNFTVYTTVMSASQPEIMTSWIRPWPPL